MQPAIARPRGPRIVAALRRHEPGRGPQAAPAGVAQRDHGRADRRAGGAGVPFDGLDVAGLDGDRGEIEVGVDAGDAAGARASAAEGSR